MNNEASTGREHVASSAGRKFAAVQAANTWRHQLAFSDAVTQSLACYSDLVTFKISKLTKH